MKNLVMLRGAFSDLFSAYSAAIQKYPLSFLATLVITTGLIGWHESWWAHLFDPDKEYLWPSLVLTGLSLYPLGVLCRLAGQRYGYTWLWSLLGFVTAGLAGWFYYASSWADPYSGWVKLPPLVLIWLAGVLLPYHFLREARTEFIPYSRSLLVRGSISGVFSLALFAGLALAIAAVDILFHVDVPDDLYLYIYFISIGVVMPGHLLSGLPWDSEEDNVRTGYPNIGFYVSRYLLIPFTAGYLLILYAYFLRQLIRQEWPEGWIGPLSIGLASLALFTRYFTQRMADREWNGFERTVINLVFPALIPVGMAIVLAINERVGFYGWTEGRWAGTLVGTWITLTGLFYSFRPNADLRWGLAGLWLLIAINWVGPLSATGKAERNQVARLEDWESNNLKENSQERPWEQLDSARQSELLERITFFADRDRWDLLEERSDVWQAYREYRGADEPPSATWKAFSKQFRKIENQKEILDWACEELLWLGAGQQPTGNSRTTFARIERGRTNFGSWELIWRYPPKVRFIPDGRSGEIDLGAQMQALLRDQPMYRRYKSDELPCLTAERDGHEIRICLTLLTGRFQGQDTLVNGAEGWVRLTEPDQD